MNGKVFEIIVCRVVVADMKCVTVLSAAVPLRHKLVLVVYLIAKRCAYKFIITVVVNVCNRHIVVTLADIFFVTGSVCVGILAVCIKFVFRV